MGLSRDGQRVGPGEAGVEEDKGEGSSYAGGVLECFEGRRTVRHRCWLGLPRAQPIQQGLSCGGIIVDNEDAKAAQMGWRPRPGGIRWDGLQLETNCEKEGAASTRIAFDGNPASHEPDQLRGDRQPQAGATIAARGGTVRLLKSLKDLLLFVRGDADTGVAHLKLQ
jgi:hypothetical protein